MSALTFLTFTPLVGAALAAIVPKKHAGYIRALGFGFMLSSLAWALFLAFSYRRDLGGIQFSEWHAWIPNLNLGITYFLGVDGLSTMLILLAAIITPFALLAAGSSLSKLNVVMMLLLQSALFGTFTALNFIHWFLFYELSLVPAFFLIRSGGGKLASVAAFRFFVYTLLGGLAMLVSFLAIQLATHTFDLLHLASLGQSGDLDRMLDAQFGSLGFGPGGISLLVFAGIFLGLAVKVPVVPFHTWLPDAYAEAPSPVSMLLTGLMSKMGLYGFLRLLLPLFPARMQSLATPLLWLAVITIVFSAIAALAQKDIKRLLAYSSVNHLGYCLLAIFAFAAVPHGAPNDRAAAMDGVLLQIFNHGLTASALFCFVAFIERRSGGLRGLADFGGLRSAAPVFAGLMGIAIFSSLGLPGLNGFVGEFLIFKGTLGLGAFQMLNESSGAVLRAVVFSAIGLFVTAVFLLNLIQKVFTGPLPERWAKFPDLSSGEILTVAPVITLIFVLGIYPQLLIALFNKTVLFLP